MNIKKGDQVAIIAGKDKGATGKVQKVISDRNRVIVEGINLYKKRVRPTKQGEKGETVMTPRSLNVSNVALICQACKKASRIGHRMDGDKKVRYCKKCSATIN